MKTDFAAVEETVIRYVTAFHEGDADELRTLFLPGCTLRSAKDGAITEYALSDWLAHVAGRPSPASLGHPLEHRMRGIEFAGPECASAIVEMAVPATTFVDCLHLLRSEGMWRIAAKTFHAQARDAK